MSLDLLYFANPMCSWCWGFQPSIRALAAAGHQVTVALGSLGADRARPMRAADKASVREHWEHVAALSGQPFDFGFFERAGFVYDTLPPCRALLVVRRRFPALALPFLGRLQERFYALGQDITDRTVLRAAAGEFGVDGDDFEAALAAPASAAEVAAEWAQTADLGVTGYPTLLALHEGGAAVVTIGWRAPDELVAAVAALAAPPRPAG